MLTCLSETKTDLNEVSVGYNLFSKYNQQDATFHKLFIFVRGSTCFRRFFSNGLTNTRRCMCSFELLMTDGKTV